MDFVEQENEILLNNYYFKQLNSLKTCSRRKNMINFTRFTSDNINIFLILIDCSKSMEERHEEVIKGLESFKKVLRIFQK